MLPDRLSDEPLALDFDSMRERLRILATRAFPAWTDHDSAGFGNVLLDLYAYVAETLGFYIEHQGREARLATATRRANVLAHARMLGYRPSGATAARTQLTFTLAKPVNDDVPIRSGYIVRTSDVSPAVAFRVVEDVHIAAGEREVRVMAESSQLHALLLEGTGLPGQTFVLPRKPYLDGSATVSTPEGVMYREVPNFLDSGSGDPHFEVLVDEGDQATLVFGNGALGLAPRGRLDVTYSTGGGAQTNVEAYSVVATDTPLLDKNGQPVAVTVMNMTAAEGGTDRESIEVIRRNAPESLRVVHRTITREDFEVNARKVPGVARALMLTSNDNGTGDRQGDQEHIVQENNGRLLIVPHGGGGLSEQLRQAVIQQVTHEHPCTLTFQVAVETPKYVTIDIDAELELIGAHAGSGLALRNDILDEVRRALGVRFRITEPSGAANPRVDFGFYARGASGHADVAWSDVVAVICSVPNVRKVVNASLNGAQQDVPLAAYEFPVLGNVRLRLAERL